jgi:hypothetical protein
MSENIKQKPIKENMKQKPIKTTPRILRPPRAIPANFHNSKTKPAEDISTTRPDVSAILDHVLTAGAKIRHDNFRQNLFATTQEQRLQREYQATLDRPTTRPGAPPPALGVLDNHVHAEDIRLYGSSNADHHSRTERFNGLAQYPWPSIDYEGTIPQGSNYHRPPKLTTDDKPWNLEHGDTIHPLAFSKAKLSALPLQEEDRASVNGNNMYVGKTDMAVENSQVPRALLLRCWQRAVHAASTTTHVAVDAAAAGGGGAAGGGSAAGGGDTSTSTKRSYAETQGQTRSGTGASDQPLELEVDPVDTDTATATAQSAKPIYLTVTARSTRSQKGRVKDLLTYAQNLEGPQEPQFGKTAHDYSRKAAMKKCKEWDIILPNIVRSECPNCTMIFGSKEKLSAHFHGDENQRGCCWNILHKKQREILDVVLQENVKWHTEAIIELVMSKAKDKNPPQKGAKRARLFNWYDILQSVESEYQHSLWVQASPERDHPVLETMELITTPNRTPLVLNQMVLEAFRRRLIDRYADVPY